MRRRRLWPRLLAAGVAVAGVVLVVLGTLLDTVWKAPTVATVTVAAADGVPVVITAPGALSLEGSTVEVEAGGQGGQPVFLGVGRTLDVNAYLGDVSRQALTGISAKGNAIVRREGSQSQASDPAHSDVWVASILGTGAAQLSWPEQKGSWTLLAATDGTGSGPRQVTFTWPLPATASAAPTVIALGALLLGVGVVAFALVVVRARGDEAS